MMCETSESWRENERPSENNYDLNVKCESERDLMLKVRNHRKDRVSFIKSDNELTCPHPNPPLNMYDNADMGSLAFPCVSK